MMPQNDGQVLRLILHYNISIEKNLYEYRKIRLKLGKKCGYLNWICSVNK